MSTSPSLALFARPPRPGEAKTRLGAVLGCQGAADLYAASLQDVLAKCLDIGFDMDLWVAGDPDDPALLRVPGVREVRRRAQPEGDLGVRMATALAAGLERSDRALVVGTDVPTLPPSRLLAAWAALDEGSELVLGPAADGGYYLIGVRDRVPPVLDGVAWSTGRVLEQTLERARRAAVRVRRLSPWYDVDTPEDLILLRTHLQLVPGAAPATARLLRTGRPLF